MQGLFLIILKEGPKVFLADFPVLRRNVDESAPDGKVDLKGSRSGSVQ
jgi:hypothetical protein